jgi:hypothetical protein
MTNEEIIAKAWEHAKVIGMRHELLHDPSVRDAAIVYFQTQKPDEKVEMVLDSKTGEFIGASMPGSDEIGIFPK